METVEISDEMVNPCGEKKLVPDDFDLLKTIGQGGYGKVGFLIHSFSSFFFFFKICPHCDSDWVTLSAMFITAVKWG